MGGGYPARVGNGRSAARHTHTYMSWASPLAMALLLVAAPRRAVAQDIESTLASRLVSSVSQFPCTRLINVNNIIGCACACGGHRCAVPSALRQSGVRFSRVSSALRQSGARFARVCIIRLTTVSCHTQPVKAA